MKPGWASWARSVAIVGECEPTVAILDALPLTGSVRAAESGSGGGGRPNICTIYRTAALLLVCQVSPTDIQTDRQTDRHRVTALLLVCQVSPTNRQTDRQTPGRCFTPRRSSFADRQTDRQTDRHRTAALVAKSVLKMFAPMRCLDRPKWAAWCRLKNARLPIKVRLDWIWVDLSPLVPQLGPPLVSCNWFAAVSSIAVIRNETVPKIIINNRINLFFNCD